MIKKAYNWVKDKTKKAWKWIVVLVVGGSALALASGAPAISEHLQLKAPVADIKGDRIITYYDKDERGRNVGEPKQAVLYIYDTKRKTSNTPREMTEQTASADNLTITNEILAKRTMNKRTFATDDPQVFVSEISASSPQRYEDEQGEWWDLEYATTSIDAFNEQMGYRPFLVHEAFADITSISARASDGWVNRSAGEDDWANVRDGAGTGSNYTDAGASVLAVYIDTGPTSTQFIQNRSAVASFDTSSIGSDNVDSAKFWLYVGTLSGELLTGNQHDVILASANIVSDWSLENADYGRLGFRSDGDEVFASLSYSALSAGGYNVWTLLTAGEDYINTASISRFSLQFNAAFDDNVTPTWAGELWRGVEVRFSETASDPLLVVVHSAPSPAAKVPAVELPGGGNIEIKDGNLELR